MGFVLERRDEIELACNDSRKSASHTNEDVRDLSGGDCDAPIWLIVWCVWVSDESHFGHILDY